MPSLSVTFYGNTGPLDAAMTAEKAKISAFQKAIAASSLSPEAKSAAMAKLALDEEINRRIVNNDAVRQSIRKRRVAKEMAEIAAGSGGFGWLGKAKEEAGEVGKAASAGLREARGHATGLRGIIRETFVIVREFLQGRGGGRIAGSFSYLLQQAGQLKNISLVTMTIWGTAFVAAAALVYERIWGIKNLVRELSFDMSQIDIGDEYIPMLKRHLSDVKNEEREINQEIRRTVELYNSATESAKRLADANKEHFEFLRRMNELSPVPEQIKIQRGAEINAAERQSEIEGKIAEQKALQAESAQKLKDAQSIHVNTNEEDEKNLKQQEKLAEDARKFLKETQGGGFGREFKKSAASVTGGLFAGMNPFADPFKQAENIQKAMDKPENAEREGLSKAASVIIEANKVADQVAQNNILRARKQELEAAAQKSAAAAAEIGLDLPRLRSQAAQRDAEEAMEARAKIFSGGAARPDLTANQRIGAYALPVAQSQIIDLTKQSLAHLASIDTKVGNMKPQDVNGAFE